MDQELVALVAAGVGLVGAIGGAAIGGVAAARGARIGAETAAKATAKQVHDQAIVDHGHWLREHRLEAYRTLLIEYDAYAIAATALQRLLEYDRNQVDNPETRNVGAAALAVTRTYFAIRLLGPEAVKGKALQLRQRVDEHADNLGAWRRAFLSGDDAAVGEAEARANVLRTEIRDAHSEFVTVVSGVVTSVELSARQPN